MEQKSADKAKDENENRLGLLKQSSNILGKSDTSSKAPTAASQPTSSPATSQLSSAATAKLPATTTAVKEPMEPEAVTDLNQTVQSDTLRTEFRKFLREKLDNNKSDNSEHKKMFEQWLDYVILCKEIFALPETETDSKVKLMIRIGDKFLAKPPDGYNLALKSQLNRKELEAHCSSLSQKTPDLKPNSDLLKDGYEFIFTKLESKHDIFKKTYKPTTTLAALLCSVL